MDAILGELCALERRCDGDIAATPAPDSQRSGRPTSARINAGDNTDIKNEGGIEIGESFFTFLHILHSHLCNSINNFLHKTPFIYIILFVIYTIRFNTFDFDKFILLLQVCALIVLTMIAHSRTRCPCCLAKVRQVVAVQDTNHLRPPCTQSRNSNRINLPVRIFVLYHFTT